MKTFLLNLAAGISFFTRLPLHRLVIPPKENFSRVLPFATIAGWIVGLFAAGCWWLLSMVLPFEVCILLTIAATVIFTGALHEDGFADFVDGFGGGYTRERILAIMKDSQIGTYGVISLILLFAVRVGVLTDIDEKKIPALLITGAVVGRYIGVFLPSLLPYARTIEASKIQVGLTPLTPLQATVATFIAVGTICYFFGPASLIALAITSIPLPIIAIYIKQKIGGYTGDCCGMLITLSEIVWYIAILAIY